MLPIPLAQSAPAPASDGSASTPGTPNSVGSGSGVGSGAVCAKGFTGLASTLGVFSGSYSSSTSVLAEAS